MNILLAYAFLELDTQISWNQDRDIFYKFQKARSATKAFQKVLNKWRCVIIVQFLYQGTFILEFMFDWRTLMRVQAEFWERLPGLYRKTWPYGGAEGADSL